ncbi:MAG: ABC transporter ATP-binding protein [Clostridia bacterium]|nr:ABC transporter ATP-binding protein [Clostridia bacterium]
MALITCKNLSLAYDSVNVAEDINFAVNKGEYVCVVGENGSGKTTLMRALLGLHKTKSGDITLGEGLKRNQIGYLPQQTPTQRDFPASVKEVVLSGFVGGMGLRPFYNKAERDRAEKVMERLELSDVQNRSYSELSGGQQQRVLLARALCATGKLLLLDEPAASLDNHIALKLYDIIEGLNKEDGIAVIMISHDVQSAVKYADKILHMGAKTVFYDKADYLASDDFKRLSAEKGAC